MKARTRSLLALVAAVAAVAAMPPGGSGKPGSGAPAPAASAGGEADAKAAEDVDERIEMLADLLANDGDYRVRVQAAFSLAKIGDPKVVPFLVEALGDKHPTVRAAAASALGKLGAEEAVPALEKALEDPVESVQEAAREALSLIMKDPKKLAELDAIQPVITDVDFHKVEAVFVIGAFKNKSGSPRDDLEKVFKKAMVKHLLDLGMPNSMIVTSGDVPPVALERLEKGKARGFYFTGTLVKLAEAWEEEKRFVVDATMSLACMKYPDQILAMTMQATAQASVLKVSYKKSIVPKLENESIDAVVSSLCSTLKTNYAKLSGEGEDKKGKKGKGKKGKKG